VPLGTAAPVPAALPQPGEPAGSCSLAGLAGLALSQQGGQRYSAAVTGSNPGRLRC